MSCQINYLTIIYTYNLIQRKLIKYISTHNLNYVQNVYLYLSNNDNDYKG